jgi:hypothetical protein
MDGSIACVKAYNTGTLCKTCTPIPRECFYKIRLKTTREFVRYTLQCCLVPNSKAVMLEQGRLSDELLKHPHVCFVALQKLFQAVEKVMEIRLDDKR